MLETVDEIQQMLNGIDPDDIGYSTENMSMDFSTALKNAVDIKMKGPAFDEFENLASLYTYQKQFWIQVKVDVTYCFRY